MLCSIVMHIFHLFVYNSSFKNNNLDELKMKVFAEEKAMEFDSETEERKHFFGGENDAGHQYFNLAQFIFKIPT